MYKLQSNKTAMLVIHGIGEQNPYETLDSFARGVFSYLQDPCHMAVELRPREIAHKDWTQVFMRIAVDPQPDGSSRGYVDLYEYYWAPYTEDKISALDTLKWLIKTDLTPLRYFANNLQEMMAGHARSFRRSAWLFWREIRRIVLLYLPLALGLIWLLTWFPRAPSVGDILKYFPGLLKANLGWPRPLVLGCYALGALMVYFTLQSAAAYLRRRRRTMQGWAEVAWFVFAAVSAVFLLWLGHTIAMQYGVSFSALWRWVWDKWVLILGVAGAIFLRYILTGYVGDVAVYVNADAKSKNYAARSEILKGSTAALKQILADEKYERVVLAGHSLGSVIAYDTINDLISEVSADWAAPNDPPQSALTFEQLQKLTGLVTFGSPLDKIYYFFRTQVKEDQAIRAQILSMLHSFRKVPSGRKYEPYQFTYNRRLPEGLIWLNAWSPLDPVSARLHFYVVDEQEWFWYSVPGLAHLGYWNDRDFYSFFGRRLLVR